MDIDTRRERAIAAGFMPAWDEALIKLTLPAGIAVPEASPRAGLSKPLLRLRAEPQKPFSHLGGHWSDGGA
jgi:hypothetical protein